MINKLTIRSLEKQFEASRVKEIREIQNLLFSSIYDDSVGKYYVEEICKSLEAGLLLASINLIICYLEIVLRDLLFYRILNNHKINPNFNKAASILQRQIEDTRDPQYSFIRILKDLEKYKDIEKIDRENLVCFYNEVRTPLHHGLIQRFVRNEGRRTNNLLDVDIVDWFGRVRWMELESKLEGNGVQLLDDATNMINKFSDKIKMLQNV